MGVVRREGKWRMSKVNDGLYEILERDQLIVEVVTDEYQGSGGVFGSGASTNPTIKTIEVSDFSEAEDVFYEYAEGNRGGGLGLF